MPSLATIWMGGGHASSIHIEVGDFMLGGVVGGLGLIRGCAHRRDDVRVRPITCHAWYFALGTPHMVHVVPLSLSRRANAPSRHCTGSELRLAGLLPAAADVMSHGPVRPAVSRRTVDGPRMSDLRNDATLRGSTTSIRESRQSTDADRQGQPATRKKRHAAEGSEDLIQHLAGRALTPNLGGNHRKLVTTQRCDGVLLPHTVAQAGRDLL